jgi:glycogen synthase
VIEPRVLLTTDVVGGVWDFNVGLANELAASFPVTLLALGEPTAAQRKEAAQTGAELISARLKLEWMQNCEADVARTRELVATIARDLQPSVIHASQFAAACADVDIPVVLTVHSDVLSWRRWTYGSDDLPLEWQSYAALVREALSCAAAIVAVSQFLANEVRSLYGVDRCIEVIHNGWPHGGEPSNETGRTTLVAGRLWDAAKNIWLAARAAEGWDPGSVYLAGQQRHPEHGHAAEIPSPLVPLGFLPRVDLDAWLRRSTVYLSAARYDPFGLLPLQAALNGCALLLSDIPSYRELWDGAACFFHSDDVADLRRKWQTLLDDSRLRNELRQRGFDRARTCFTARRMASAYAALYAKLTTRVAA